MTDGQSPFLRLDDVLPTSNVVYLLRSSSSGSTPTALTCVPELREYSARWGLTAPRAARLKPDTLVMHPGPMNRV